MMLPGSGLGSLPFTVNPLTPTGSTNCDTGTALIPFFFFTYNLHTLPLTKSFACTLHEWFFCVYSASLPHAISTLK